MPLSHSPSSASHKKNIFQKLFGKVKGAVMALGIIATPVVAQTENSTSLAPKTPSVEERLASAQKMNLESIKSIDELQKTIEFTWYQLKDIPGAPEQIRDKYGHITTEGLTWIESELPKEYHQRVQKYQNIKKELEKIDKKDPKWGAWEYSLVSLGALLIGIIGYKFGKVSKKELEKLQNEHTVAHDEATKHMRERALAEGENIVLKQKIAEIMAKNREKDLVVDAEILEPEENIPPISSTHPEDAPITQEIPGALKDTFLTQDEFKDLREILTADLSSETPSEAAKKLQESIQNLADGTGTKHEKAARLGTMSEDLISYARYQKMSEEAIKGLLRALEKSFQGQDLYFGSSPVIGQPFDNTTMLQIGKSQSPRLKVSNVLSLAVLGPNTHPQATTKTMSYALAKVNCS